MTPSLGIESGPHFGGRRVRHTWCNIEALNLCRRIDLSFDLSDKTERVACGTIVSKRVSMLSCVA